MEKRTEERRRDIEQDNFLKLSLFPSLPLSPSFYYCRTGWRRREEEGDEMKNKKDLMKARAVSSFFSLFYSSGRELKGRRKTAEIPFSWRKKRERERRRRAPSLYRLGYTASPLSFSFSLKPPPSLLPFLFLVLWHSGERFDKYIAVADAPRKKKPASKKPPLSPSSFLLFFAAVFISASAKKPLCEKRRIRIAAGEKKRRMGAQWQPPEEQRPSGAT